MKKIIAFVSTLDEYSNSLWLKQLNNIFKNYEIILFNDLEKKDYKLVEVAIVANPQIKDLKKLKNLIWVQSLWAGVEKLLIDAKNNSFDISRMIDEDMSEVMSDSVLSWSLYLYKDMPLYKKQQNLLLWKEHEVLEKNKLRISILGLGKLGMASALKLQSNNFNVQAWSRSQKKIKGIKTYIGNNGLETLLKETDILISLLPLSKETENLLNAEKLQLLKKSASVINFSRAKIFDYEALEVLLEKKHLKHAVLDVFYEEPLNKESSLWKNENITILPHISAPTNRKTASRIAYKNIDDYFCKNINPLFVDKTKGY